MLSQKPPELTKSPKVAFGLVYGSALRAGNVTTPEAILTGLAVRSQLLFAYDYSS